jgi:hypothetical protein
MCGRHFASASISFRASVYFWDVRFECCGAPEPIFFAARKTFSMPAAAPRKKNAINPHGLVPSARSKTQPRASPTHNADTSSIAIRRPTPSAPPGGALLPRPASCRSRSCRAWSILLPSCERESDGGSSFIKEAQPPDFSPAATCPEAADHSNASPRCQYAASAILNAQSHDYQSDNDTRSRGLPQAHGVRKVDGDQLRHSRLGHSYAEQTVRTRHRDAMMGDQ